MSPNAIALEGVSRRYRLYRRPVDRLKEVVSRRPFHRDFWALHNVSIAVPRGQTVGIVGQNGSGKSTLLQVMAGVLAPTTGRITVDGRVAALLELGAGFNAEFTGRENVLLSGAIIGVPEAEMRPRFDAIAEFADIGEFIDQPVKTYSSGMYVRLAFATAISVDPAILLVDETLAVGDAYFQHCCMVRLAELRQRGVTIVIVSHDAGAIQQLCDRVLWVSHGQVVDDGPADRVVARYLAATVGPDPDGEEAARGSSGARAEDRPALTALDEALASPHVDQRSGRGGAQIVGVGLFGEAGRPITSIVHGRSFELRVRVRFGRALRRPVVGWVLRDRLGVTLASSDTTQQGCALPSVGAGETYTVQFLCTPPLLHPGHYALSLSVADHAGANETVHDQIDNAVNLDVIGEVPMDTLMRFPTTCGYE